MNVSNSLAWALWLDSVPGLGAKTKINMLRQIQDPTELRDLTDQEIRALLEPKKAQLFLESRCKAEPDKLFKIMEKKGMNFTYFKKEDYPNRLKHIPDPPYALYYYGSLPEEERRGLAVIGARVCSGYGKKMAEEIGAQLAAAGVSVISGMARGIDGFAQKAALAGGGLSYAVLGCGADICYPEQNRTLYEALKRQGGVLSEYLPETTPLPQLFPLRNRIISGLSDAVLVVEARERSGTLITVDLALEQGKDVYVLPGRISDPLSAGCNRLICQGAQIVLSVEEFAGVVTQKGNGSKTKDMIQTEEPEKTEDPLLRFLDYYPKSLEQIEEESGVEAREAMLLLMNLCMEGKVRQISSFYFVKI